MCKVFGGNLLQKVLHRWVFTLRVLDFVCFFSFVHEY